MREPKLPEPWAAAMRQPPGARINIAGAYVNDGRLGHRLSRIARREVFKGAPQLELQMKDAKHLAVSARNGTGALETEVFEAVSDANSGAVILRSELKAGASSEGAQVQGRKMTFVKGADGYLYGQYIEYGAAVFFYVVPVVGSAGYWERWAPRAN